jgi:hypothetical protein
MSYLVLDCITKTEISTGSLSAISSRYDQASAEKELELPKRAGVAGERPSNLLLLRELSGRE